MNAAERIYKASTREDGISVRLAELLARRIEDDIASHPLPAGDALGSLRDLSERYSVGRAVTREAVGLLERRGLGSLRPGPCGGFIVKKPQSDVIADELAGYFREIGITLGQLMDAREAVDMMTARLAAETSISSIGLARVEVAAKAGGLVAHLAVRGELARLTRAPALVLMSKCLNNLAQDFRDRSNRNSASLDVAAMRQALTQADANAAAGEMGRLHTDLGKHLRSRDIQHEMPGEPSSRTTDERTLAALVARRIAGEIVRTGTTGRRLGSEWELCERFSVSRLTLRQAIRLLQDRGLVECRRGRGNGLVIHNRRGSGAIKLVLAYLIGRQMDPMAAGTFLFQLNCFVPALAIDRADEQQRRTLELLLERVEASDCFDRYDLLSLVHCVSQLAENPIIDFFSRCLAAYEARFHPSLAHRLAVSVHASYFELVRQLLNEMPVGTTHDLAKAKHKAAEVLLNMSRDRPI